MSVSEFDLIRRYFTDQAISRKDVGLTVGDDAAVLTVPAGHELVVTVDTLIAGVHFPVQTTAADIGWKAAAVNLSDLAAMGAEPAWVTLALTLPAADEAWLRDFSQGFFALLSQYNVQLVGGDTTRGPLSITVQAHGFVPMGKALRRDAACAEDLIFVSGPVGDAGFALRAMQQPLSVSVAQLEPLLARLNRPLPQVRFGQALRDVAHAVIDISDGLLADVGHICQSSLLGARLYLNQLPYSAALSAAVSTVCLTQQENENLLAELALTAGDDYELCFTAAAERRTEIEALGAVCIGVMTDGAEGSEVQCYDAAGLDYTPTSAGYDHFALT